MSVFILYITYLLLLTIEKSQWIFYLYTIIIFKFISFDIICEFVLISEMQTYNKVKILKHFRPIHRVNYRLAII